MGQFDTNQNQPALDSEKILESAILSKLKMTPEERIEAHENARQLMLDLQSAGKLVRQKSKK
jgi:hypothetical protein